MVRSPFAHARISGIGGGEGAAGVVAVLTGADVGTSEGSLPNARTVGPDQKTPNHPSIAVDRVAFAEASRRRRGGAVRGGRPGRC